MSVVVEIPIWEDEDLATADEAFWAGLANLVMERNAAVLRLRGDKLLDAVYAKHPNGELLTRWACDLKQTRMKGVEAVARDHTGCCTDLAAFHAAELVAEGEENVEVAIEDRTGRGRPYHAIVLVDGEPEEPDVSEYFGMGATG